MIRAWCIDPGKTESGLAVVLIKGRETAPPWGIIPCWCNHVLNETLVQDIGGQNPSSPQVLLIERMFTIYGGGGSLDQLDALEWGGRFIQASGLPEGSIFRIARPTAASAVTGSAKSGDSKVRRGLIDAYGGDLVNRGKRCRCGGKRKSPCPRCVGSGLEGWEVPPGPLAGWSGDHVFAALALAFAAFCPGGVAEHLRNQGAS